MLFSELYNRALLLAKTNKWEFFILPMLLYSAYFNFAFAKVATNGCSISSRPKKDPIAQKQLRFKKSYNVQ